MKIINFLLIVLFVLTNVSCDLDYENRNEITPDNVWTKKSTIVAFLNDIYSASMPGWPVTGNGSDEGMVWNADMPVYLRGIIDKENTVVGFNYTTIEKTNFFLDRLLHVVPEGVLTEDERNHLEGQAKFWRAWWYWSRVSAIGGIPLITEPQNVSDKESLFIPRNSTSECMTQILADLDDAIAKLPPTWKDEDYGRIDKCAAMAFKGRVLLYYACPLFNKDNNSARWQAAYDANKAAVEFLRAQGKELYPNYGDIWEKERNSEVVMVNQYSYPDKTFNQASIRPNPFSKSAYDNDAPVMSVLLAFPKKDGSPMILDRDLLAKDDDYNKRFTDDFYTNRDDRFYTTIFCGGTLYPGKNPLAPGIRLWTTWRKVKSTYRSMYLDQGGTIYTGKTGFYRIKGLDRSLDASTVGDCETDWIPIRFAEVLMNYGECANQVNKPQEALQVLYDIRKRAGILPGADNRYGITATAKNEIQEAYISENFAEFAFENKRMEDLRRWKRYDIINNQKYKSALFCVLNGDEDISEFDWTSDIMDENVRGKFHMEVIENIYGGAVNQYKLDLNHWFYAISRDDLERNSKLEQNNEWEGNFDPLK